MSPFACIYLSAEEEEVGGRYGGEGSSRTCENGVACISVSIAPTCNANLGTLALGSSLSWRFLSSPSPSPFLPPRVGPHQHSAVRAARERGGSVLARTRARVRACVGAACAPTHRARPSLSLSPSSSPSLLVPSSKATYAYTL